MPPPLHIDPHALIAFRDGRAVPLSVSEWRMLRLLLATGLITYEEWEIGYRYPPKTLRQTAHHLRLKLGLPIVNIVSVGYELEKQP
jgi:DNA-binding response OmpR family regulator